jgi:hypothetical protein
MLSDSVVATLQIGHAGFNGLLFLAFAFQGLMGLRIRKKRVAGVPQDFTVVKRHRKLGPALAALVPLGYLAGLSTTYLSRGVWVRHPEHFTVGTVLLIVVGATFLASRRIRGAQSPWRNRHAALGLVLACVFLVQIFLGLGVLL